MQADSVLYNGKSVLKAHFRAFVYSKDGAKKLMNSWPEYEKHIQTGVWFDSQKAIEDKVNRKKPDNKKVIMNSTHEGGALLNDESLTGS